jgi:hypothetical protein
LIYISKKQFDDSTGDFTCRGFNFAITVGDMVFQVRNYHDTPGEFTVISPAAAGQSPQARQLVDYLVSVLGGQRIFFYEGRIDVYQEIDLQTLEFKDCETAPSNPALKPIPIIYEIPLSSGLPFVPA